MTTVYAPPNKMREKGDGDLMSILGRGTTIEAGAYSAVLGYTYSW